MRRHKGAKVIEVLIQDMRDITIISLQRWVHWWYCLKTRAVGCNELSVETTDSSGIREVVSVLVRTLRPPPAPVCLLCHEVKAMLIRISWCVSSQIDQAISNLPQAGWSYNRRLAVVSVMLLTTQTSRLGCQVILAW